VSTTRRLRHKASRQRAECRQPAPGDCKQIHEQYQRSASCDICRLACGSTRARGGFLLDFQWRSHPWCWQR
jgi:hypothetical protein